jgi:two-component system, cell cycle sensor histidine kinase and response regulator CckA
VAGRQEGGGLAQRDPDRKTQILIGTFVKRCFGSLTLRMVIPVVLVASLMGMGLYLFVLRAVSEFADHQIREGLAGLSRNIYDICDRNFTQLVRSGEMDDDRAVRIKKALTLGAIEDYAKRSLLGCRVYDTRQGETLLLEMSPGLSDYLSHHPPEGTPLQIRFDGRIYYLSRFGFNPWDWKVDLLKDTAEYAPLVKRVKLAYTVTAVLLLFSILILLLLMEKLLRSPLNRIISAIRAGRSPDYRGIHELEFLSDSIAAMKRSLEERNWWIEQLYRVAVATRGELFFRRIAETLSEALGLNVLITRRSGDEDGFTSVASAGEPKDTAADFPADGLPLQQIADEKRPIVMASGAWRRMMSAPCLSQVKAESYAGLPLFSHDGEPIGVINAFGNGRTFSEWDLGLIKTAGQMAGAEFELMEQETEKELFRTQVFRAQKMESLGVLAGGIAHDFNNLLMGIQGNVSLMCLDVDKDAVFLNRLKNIEEYVQRGSQLTSQLLGLARGGKYEVRPRHINQVIRRSAEMFGRTKREIAIHERYAEDILPVEVDQGQMEQVLLNLFVNAWQAMPEGGDLYLETQNVVLDREYVRPFSVEAGRYVRISVTDTGIGMDKATQERIFDPFFTTKEMGRGTGLGLASAYGIIKNHGGFMNVYSEKGHGATFSIYLPACDKAAVLEVRHEGEVLGGSESILLVDDEEMILEIGKALLERLGYTVLTAGSGEEAVRICEENKEKIQIVLLDMIMPDMSGRDTFERLKAIIPGVKVLLSSGYSINGQAREILDCGCDGFIQKPFKIDELSQRLREILGKG